MRGRNCGAVALPAEVAVSGARTVAAGTSNKRQAEDGFARQGNLPGEDYTDANHKPELVFALTPFMAMNGFRPYQEIANHFLRWMPRP